MAIPLTALRELTLPTQKALTSRDQKTFLARSNYSIEVGRGGEPLLGPSIACVSTHLNGFLGGRSRD